MCRCCTDNAIDEEEEGDDFRQGRWSRLSSEEKYERLAIPLKKLIQNNKKHGTMVSDDNPYHRYLLYNGAKELGLKFIKLPIRVSWCGIPYNQKVLFYKGVSDTMTSVVLARKGIPAELRRIIDEFL